VRLLAAASILNLCSARFYCAKSPRRRCSPRSSSATKTLEYRAGTRCRAGGLRRSVGEAGGDKSHGWAAICGADYATACRACISSRFCASGLDGGDLRGRGRDHVRPARHDGRLRRRFDEGRVPAHQAHRAAPGRSIPRSRSSPYFLAARHLCLVSATASAPHTVFSALLARRRRCLLGRDPKRAARLGMLALQISVMPVRGRDGTRSSPRRAPAGPTTPCMSLAARRRHPSCIWASSAARRGRAIQAHLLPDSSRKPRAPLRHSSGIVDCSRPRADRPPEARARRPQALARIQVPFRQYLLGADHS